MTGDVTGLEVSKRLAKVWPPPNDAMREGFWYGRDGVAYPTAADLRGAEERGLIPARSLGELEAETRRMGLDVVVVLGNSARRRSAVAFVGPERDSPAWVGTGKGENIIDAVGSALAEAKEKL